MTLWLLVITVYFSTGDPLRLPPARSYANPVECSDIGKQLAAWLTQDGTRVEWKCVEIGQ